MKTNKSERKAIYKIIVLLFIALTVLLNGQAVKDENLNSSKIVKNIFQNNSNSAIDDFAIPDLLKIILLGGMSRVDTSLIKGEFIDDTTLVYSTENCKDTLNFWINYIKKGEVVDNWTPLIDSATVRYSVGGTFRNTLIGQELQQSAKEFLIHGLLASSDILTIETIEVNSTINIRYAFASAIRSHNPGFYTIIWDRFSEMHIKKVDLDIMTGIGNILIEAGLLDPFYGWVGPTAKKKNDNRIAKASNNLTTRVDTFNVEFIGNHQLKLSRDGEESIISYNNLKFLFP